MSKLSDDFLKAVGEYMLVETPLARADVAIVFGGQHADELANHAADLYEKGYFGLIVVTGGVKTAKGQLEAWQMRDVLVARGVPEDIILVEDEAKNTGENVINSMKLLDRAKGLESINSVLGIGQIHGSRRFIMTLEKHWPAVTKMFSTPNYYPASRGEWHKDETFRRDVLREFNKVAPYKEKGFIEEVDLDAMAKKIAALPPPGPRP
jgi:hypothetical protein